MNEENITRPVLSICIPTYNRTDILRETLTSIFSQSVNPTLFEVCISDDSTLSDTEDMIKKSFSNHKNLVYKRKVFDSKTSQHVASFYNGLSALEMGKGNFLKLCNDTSFFFPGSLFFMIKNIQSIQDKKPVISFAMSTDEKKANIRWFNDFDSFFSTISYLSTSAPAFGVWKNDFDSLKGLYPEFEVKFPHTDFLFHMATGTKYVVDSYRYIKTLPVSSKGDYNLPEVFGVKYISMVQSLYERQIISYQTLQQVKSDTLDFIANWAVMVRSEPEKYTFDFSNAQEHIRQYYGNKGYTRFLDLIKQKSEKRQESIKARELHLLEKKNRIAHFIPRIMQDKGKRPLFLWGIGTNASAVEEVLGSHGLQIDGYIDRCGGVGIKRNGIPVRTSDKALSCSIYVVVSMKHVDRAVFAEFKRFGYSSSDFCCVLAEHNETS